MRTIESVGIVVASILVLCICVFVPYTHVQENAVRYDMVKYLQHNDKLSIEDNFTDPYVADHFLKAWDTVILQCGTVEHVTSTVLSGSRVPYRFVYQVFFHEGGYAKVSQHTLGKEVEVYSIETRCTGGS